MDHISVEELSIWLNQQIAQASTYPEKCAFTKVLNKLTTTPKEI
jgi:hypothetical protein